MGGALSRRKLFRTLLTVLALAGTYSFLVFREVGLVKALEAGRLHPAGLQVTEPAQITWHTVSLPALQGTVRSLVFAEAAGEFHVVTDQGELCRINPVTGAVRTQSFPLLPGPDLPAVLMPELLEHYWPGIDGQQLFLLDSENRLTVLDAESLNVRRSEPALPAMGAPKAFQDPQPFWHLAHDSSTSRLVLVVRSRSDGRALTSIQFEEPKKGFGTFRHFALDGQRGTISYLLDQVEAVQQVRWSPAGLMERSATRLPWAPFSAGEADPLHNLLLPVRRLLEWPAGEPAALAQPTEGPLAILRPDAPVVQLLPLEGKTGAASYFPRFDNIPAHGLFGLEHGIVIVGTSGQPGESAVMDLGVEVIDFKNRAVLRSSDFARGAARVPADLALRPMLAASPDGRLVGLTGPGSGHVWLATITPQPAGMAEALSSTHTEAAGQ